MPEKKNAIYFDFDGLLADTEPLHMKAFDLAFEKLGIPAKSDPENWAGRTSKEILSEVTATTKTKVPLETIRQVRRDMFSQLVKNATLMPYAYDILDHAHPRFKIGLVTSSSRTEIDPVLDGYGLHKFFDVVVTWQPDLPAKPDPAMYRKALEFAGTDPKDAVALEDSQRGVAAAKGAGLFCIAVPNDYTLHQDLCLADRVVDNLEQAEKMINTLWK